MNTKPRSSGRYSDQYSDATASKVIALPPTQRVEGRGQRVEGRQRQRGVCGYSPAPGSKTFACKHQSVAREVDACRSAARGGAR